MRWMPALLITGLAELAGYFLSLAWGFLILAGGFCMVASLLRVTAAKVQTTETRLNAHISATAPAVSFVASGGTVGGSVTIQGSHTVQNTQTVQGDQHINGNLYGTGGTLSVADNINMGGNNIASLSAVTSATDFTGASITVEGNFWLNGSSGHRSISYQSQPSGAGGPPTGGSGGISSDATSHYCGAFYAGSGAANWATNITSAVNGINIALKNSGIFA